MTLKPHDQHVNEAEAWINSSVEVDYRNALIYYGLAPVRRRSLDQQTVGSSGLEL